MDFHLLVYSPNGCSGWNWASPNLGARGFFLVTHMSAGIHAFGPSSAAFPGTFNKELDQKWDSRLDASATSVSFTYYATAQTSL